MEDRVPRVLAAHAAERNDLWRIAGAWIPPQRRGLAQLHDQIALAGKGHRDGLPPGLGQREQAPGIFAFFVVVTAGFAIFLLSNFPPTQRFGLAVVVGTAVAAMMALWVFPGLLGEAPDAKPAP